MQRMPGGESSGFIRRRIVISGFRLANIADVFSAVGGNQPINCIVNVRVVGETARLSK